MEILGPLMIVTGASLVVFVLLFGPWKKDMYIKHEHHIKAFPPGYRIPERR
jgi:hypothetical protein